MLQNVVPNSIKVKLQLLNSLNQAFISDMLEFIPLMLDFKISNMTNQYCDLMQNARLMKSYITFKESHPVFS